MIIPDLENFLNITPDPRILRMLGEIEITPLQCLCELIDNSIDAFTKEENPENPKIFINLPKEKDIHRVVKDTYKGKIPYVSNDYSVYYDKVVRDIIKSWGFGENSCL